MRSEPQISRREAEILAALGERLTNAEIATRFHIGVRTVESHVSALLRKFGAADRRELAALEATARRPSARFIAPPHLGVSVFGRDNDVIAVGQLLTAARLVTLFGTGGVGKTTLALAVAGRDEIASERARVYVDLARVGADEDVGAAFASALGVERDVPDSWTDRLAEAVGARKLLIVVDNAEHVIDATASLVSELLRRIKGVAFLVTTREPLSIPGERLWQVEPLAVTEDQAIALFCERATAVRADWASTDVLQTVGVICRRLDGLPLAIELAASEVQARSVDDIVRGLDRPLVLLEHGDRTDARHRTLRAVMDWSYDLLDQDERAVFDRLGAFVTSFSMSDAQNICMDIVPADRTEAIVVGLVARSLLRLEFAGLVSRYVLLDTIRHYALEHLDTTGTLEHARDRHADAVMASLTEAVEGLWGPDESRSVAWFDEAQADIVAAYRWLRDRIATDDLLRVAVQSYLFGWSHGRSTLRELVRDAIATIESAQTTAASPDLLALAYGAAASASNTAGESEEARRLSEKGFEHARRADDASARLCHGAAADLALFAGDTSAAAQNYAAAAEGFRSVGVPAMAAYLDAASGLALTYGGRQAEASAILERSLAAADATACPSAQAFARYTIAELIAHADSGLARQRLQEAIDLAESVRATFVAGVAELSLATLCARAGEYHTALAYYSSLIDLWRQAGNWTQQWNTLRTLVFLLVELKRYRAASELMTAITAEDASPTWGNDAAKWAAARDTINTHLEPDMIHNPQMAGQHGTPDDVLAIAEAHIAETAGSLTAENA